MDTLRDIGECPLIERLCRFLTQGSDVVVGPGDDCAVVRQGGSSGDDWLLTSDPVVEGVHFCADAPPRSIGHKAVGRVLSDIAAMGGSPRWVLINVLAPAETPVRQLDEIYEGASALAHRFGVSIVGGDVARGPVRELHAFGVGSVPCGQARLRSGARAGDAIAVTGTLGGSLLGKHLAFEPRVKEGLWLRNRVSAMIDVSDGLASDVRHIATQSGVGARIDTSALPLSAAASASGEGRSPTDHALFDGEDFELLFTAEPGEMEAIKSEWDRVFDLPVTVIGRMTPGPGVVVCVDKQGTARTLERGGFAHFE